MAVCEFCRSTLLKDAESVRDIGRMSDTLEDYSPLRIGVSGAFLQRRFGVVGRIQLRYEDGFWNEWYLLFDDGGGGWLSDASGRYALTFDRGDAAQAPPFGSLAPGLPFVLDGRTFLASDVRTAQCTSGEGELPFRVGPGWQARVADFRCEEAFLTLDYPEHGPARLYVGRSVALADLQCQLLRSDDDIAGSAGRYRGKTTALACPACGSAIQYRSGVAFHVVCPACHAELDCASGQAEVLARHEQLSAVKTTLALGAVATIDGARFEIIGLMRCGVPGDTESWHEYLLFEARRGFLWLVESSGGWERVTVVDDWPVAVSVTVVRWRGGSYLKHEEYESLVQFAAGAFNWRVSIGDRTRIVDYRSSSRKLTAEWSQREIGWSSTAPVPVEQVRLWFGQQRAIRDAGAAAEPGAGVRPHRLAARVSTVILLVLNLPLALLSGFRGVVVIAVALALLWLPVVLAARVSDPG
jgi:Domain of unknown function (DUF4178)